MIIRKFIGKTESEAAEAAKKELGEGYVIMNVKSVKPKGAFSIFKKKQVELTAAKEDDEEPIRQIRKIAQAQVAAEKNKTAVLKTAAQENTPSVQSSDVKPSSTVSAAVSSDSSNLEKKLDNLQTLLENQINRENSVLASSKENTDKAAKAVEDVKKSENTDKKAEIEEQEKEVDRFIRLLYNTMVENEVDEKYAGEIIAEAESHKKPGMSMDFLLGNIYQKMILKFGKSEGITPSDKGPKVVFFIGPTGVGKTTTIAKIASSFSLNDKKKIALLTTDTYRIAATDQLRTYAGILGVPFRVIYEPDELVKAFEDFDDCDYIFVDSAGHSHRNEELLMKQKEFINASKDMQTQIFLVLSATTKYKDLKKIADNYREISEYQLIFTKLDETGEYGNLYNMKCESGSPIAYITCGQNVPDDIESFNPQKIVKQLLGGKR
ncbi:MAG: flagellar biosynthesis protein FlhF [Lachnospiraceae bacterium]|nr:flagellar biosynthesis protein FlhF [Lachnospiraceae bacterium]